VTTPTDPGAIERRFVLLDRDGTLNEERHYLADPAGLVLYPGTVEGLRRLAGLGLGLIVVTNQSGIARGYFDHDALERVHDRLCEVLAAEGVFLEGIYVCPHGPDDGCSCRKPLPGMVEQAARDLGFDPARAFVIGDRPADVELGRAVGARSILVRTGYGAETAAAGTTEPDAIVEDLSEAAREIKRWLASSATQAEGSEEP
jgi:D-glycero-D-manno-heptose 1,7-bisphosphate phosphatase